MISSYREHIYKIYTSYIYMHIYISTYPRCILHIHSPHKIYSTVYTTEVYIYASRMFTSQIHKTHAHIDIIHKPQAYNIFTYEYCTCQIFIHLSLFPSSHPFLPWYISSFRLESTKAVSLERRHTLSVCHPVFFQQFLFCQKASHPCYETEQ